MRRLLRWARAVFDRVPTVVFVALFAALAFQLGRAGSAGHAPAEVAHAEHDEGGEWVCPMHPQIRSDEPGTCPICFMDLVPSAHEDTGGSEVSLTMSPGAARLAQLRTEEAARVPIEREVSVFGRVRAPDEGQANITAWTGGRIEQLYVEAIGERVRRGQRLARIYSPELVLAQETLIHARAIHSSAESAGSDTRARAAAAAEQAARTELRLLGISDEQIEELVGDGRADETVTIHAPAGGTVMRRLVSQGDHVERGAPILELANLDQVWVQLEIYERDLPYVTVGTAVELRAPGASGQPIAATVAFVDPVIDPMRRVARARVVLANPDGAFRPDMFVEATLRIPVVDADGRPPVSVPASAVLWTGVRSLVYVADLGQSPVVYMPVEVELGDRIADRYVIREGLFVGEDVVANGAFRLDATLQIRGGRTMMNPTSGEAGGGHEHAH